ncbi:MAG: hypothetical protein LRY55_01040 [Leadbetterella sp.]|nr:hypothetical protein [Leadbetterella sp.]
MLAVSTEASQVNAQQGKFQKGVQVQVRHIIFPSGTGDSCDKIKEGSYAQVNKQYPSLFIPILFFKLS